VALNILRGGAGINAIGAGAGWDITLVDAGIADDLPADAEKDAKCRLVRAKIAPGSRNCTKGPALTEEELEKALARGEELAGDAADQGYGIVGIGTFGAGVSSTTGALLSAAGFIADDMIDQGAGIDDAKLAHKREIIKQAVKGRKLDAFDGEELLRNFGSPDFAMMAGFMSGLEDRGIACVLDGFPAAAAAWAAWLISPKITKFLFAGHLSKSPGHKIILEHLMLDPIVNLEISLGEGVGAAIGGQILELACLSALNMATSASAGIPGGGL
jgi:nicotinate-nucleotide--dimethylbenzimidazole phosphoribosyltransferase